MVSKRFRDKVKSAWDVFDNFSCSPSLFAIQFNGNEQKLVIKGSNIPFEIDGRRRGRVEVERDIDVTYQVDELNGN